MKKDIKEREKNRVRHSRKKTKQRGETEIERDVERAKKTKRLFRFHFFFCSSSERVRRNDISVCPALFLSWKIKF
jgi:hypothetical protein